MRDLGMLARRCRPAAPPQRGPDRDDAQDQSQDHHEAEAVREGFVGDPLDNLPGSSAQPAHVLLGRVRPGQEAPHVTRLRLRCARGANLGEELAVLEAVEQRPREREADRDAHEPRRL